MAEIFFRLPDACFQLLSLPAFEDLLRHTYTGNLLSGGAEPTDTQKPLGHSDVNPMMQSTLTLQGKRSVLPLLDKWSAGHKNFPLFRLIGTKTRENTSKLSIGQAEWIVISTVLGKLRF